MSLCPRSKTSCNPPGAGSVAVTELPTAPGISFMATFWNGAATKNQMRALARDGLARYEQPRRLDSLPRTPTGKINHRARRIARTSNDPS